MREDNFYDFFVSYKVENVLLVRQVVEQLMASNIKIWFDEYQILLDDYENWEECVKENISKSRYVLIFIDKLYLLSGACQVEFKDSVEKHGYDKMILIVLDEISNPILKEVKWSFHFTGSNTINDILSFIESIIRQPIQKINLENMRIGKEYYTGKCLGFPYRLDVTSWNYRRSLWSFLFNICYKISQYFAGTGNSAGPVLYRIIENQRIEMNLYFGPEINPSHIESRIKYTVNDRELQNEMREYAKGYFNRYFGRDNVKCIGVHLVPHYEFMQFAFTYQLLPGLWCRKYSVTLPIANQVVEFVFTFGVYGSFKEFCKVAWLCDQLVISLAIKESNNAIDLTNRAFALVNQRKLDLAIVLLERAIKIDPNLGDAYNELAFIYSRKNNLEEAKKYAELAVKCNPDNPKFTNTLISIRFEQIKQFKNPNEIQIAVESFLQEIDEQIQRNPSYPGLYLMKAEAIALSGKPKVTWEEELKKVKELYIKQGKLCSGIPLLNSREIDLLIERYKQKCEVLSASCSSDGISKINLTYPQHYEQTVRDAAGKKYELTLIHADVICPYVNLIYQWKTELSYEEADELDTRARAYIACAIYDAATAAGLFCQPDYHHGQRPSWNIEGERMISLVNAGFDVSNKTCFMTIGPGMLRTKESLMVERYCNGLIEGFQTLFRKIRV